MWKNQGEFDCLPSDRLLEALESLEILADQFNPCIEETAWAKNWIPEVVVALPNDRAWRSQEGKLQEKLCLESATTLSHLVYRIEPHECAGM